MKIKETTLVKPIIEEKDRTKLPETVLCRVTYNICNVGERNANGRVYEKAVFDKVLGDDTLKEMIENRRLFGQAEHPIETQSDLQLTSHVIHNMWIDENTNNVYQTMDVLDTPMGRIVDCLIRAGCGVGVSTRAEGDLEESEDDQGKFSRVIPESYRYITTDFTADPSTFNVLPMDIKKNVASSVRAEMENKNATAGERKFATQLFESLKVEDKKDVEGNRTVAQAIKDKFFSKGIKVKYENKDYTVEKIDEAASTITISPDVVGTEVRLEQDGVIIDGNPFVKINTDGSVTIMPVSQDQFPPETEPELLSDEELTVAVETEPIVNEVEPEVEEKCDGDKDKDKKKVKEGLDQLVARKEELMAKREAGTCTLDDQKELADIEKQLKDMDVDIEESFHKDLKNKDVKAIKQQLGMATDKLLKGETLSGAERTYWDAFHKEVNKTKESANERTLPTENDVNPKIMQGNVLRSKDITWIVQEVNGSGMTIVQPKSPDTEQRVDWDKLDSYGFTKIGESLDKELSENFDIGREVVLKSDPALGKGKIKEIHGMKGILVSWEDGKEDWLEPETLEVVEESRIKLITEEIEQFDPKDFDIVVSDEDLKAAKYVGKRIPEDIYKQDGNKDAMIPYGYYLLDNDSIFIVELVQDWPWIFAADQETIDKALDALTLERQWRQKPVEKEPVFTESKSLKIKEAITRAEKEKAMEVIEELSTQINSIKNESSSSKLKFKMLMSKIKEATAVYDEVNALRSKLEEKAETAASFKKKMDVASKEYRKKLEQAEDKVAKFETELMLAKEEVKRIKSELSKMKESKDSFQKLHESTQKEIKTTKEDYENKIQESKDLGMKTGISQIISNYVERRLAELDLSIGENTRALLDECASIEDVEDILEKTKDMQRRNALHSEPLEGIRIERNQNLDPEQEKVDKEVGNAFEGMC